MNNREIKVINEYLKIDGYLAKETISDLITLCNLIIFAYLQSIMKLLNCTNAIILLLLLLGVCDIHGKLVAI